MPVLKSHTRYLFVFHILNSSTFTCKSECLAKVTHWNAARSVDRKKKASYSYPNRGKLHFGVTAVYGGKASEGMGTVPRKDDHFLV